MVNMSESSIMVAFSRLPDPRKPRNQLYSLQDILCTAIMATICNCDDYEEISDWTLAHLDWLQTLGLCTAGVPSHDTYERVFRHLDAQCFQECFIQWTQLIGGIFQKAIAIDGKTVCGSGGGQDRPLHLISAFATESSLVLGQLKTTGRGGELEGIQKLLDILALKGVVITIDAAGCHRVVAEKIVGRKGDYILAVKGNQHTLRWELENFFEQAMCVLPEEAGCGFWSTEEKSRGRTEKREVWACDQLDWLPQRDKWTGLQSIVAVKRTSTEKGKTSVETRYFISSLTSDAENLGTLIRGHWGIENSLHWHLDVTFNEDNSRTRKDNGAENLSVLRRAALNILRGDKNSKKSLKRRRHQASWDVNYLKELFVK